MDVLIVGDPADLATDVGPVIDGEARAALDRHLVHLKTTAKILKELKAARRLTHCYLGRSSRRSTWPRCPTGKCLDRSCM